MLHLRRLNWTGLCVQVCGLVSSPSVSTDQLDLPSVLDTLGLDRPGRYWTGLAYCGSLT